MKKSVLLGAVASAVLNFAVAAFAAEVNVYSFRQPQLIAPLADAFKAKTGIQVNVLFAEKGLMERLEQEGDLSPADVVLTTDIAQTLQATERGLAQPAESQALQAAIPAGFHAAGNEWFALTLRARGVYAARERVQETALSYEDLADPKFKGKLCTRPMDHAYNLSLVAAILSVYGEEYTKNWLAGVKANLAMQPSGNDRAQAKSIAAGECDIALGNSYYVGLMANNETEPEQKKWAEAIRFIFPSSEKLATNVNVSAMLLAKHAPNKTEALQFMEFLASKDAQEIYAKQNYEYPVNVDAKADPYLVQLGAFAPKTDGLLEIPKYLKRAQELVEEARFNQ